MSESGTVKTQTYSHVKIFVLSCEVISIRANEGRREHATYFSLRRLISFRKASSSVSESSSLSLL